MVFCCGCVHSCTSVLRLRKGRDAIAFGISRRTLRPWVSYSRTLSEISSRLKQDRFSVKSEQICWPLDPEAGFGHALMPKMNTDVSLFDGERTIIIECKWTPRALQTYHGSNSLRSSHLYQLHTYMSHHVQTLAGRGHVEGILLYPFADDEVDVAVRLREQWIRVRTLRLECGLARRPRRAAGTARAQGP